MPECHFKLRPQANLEFGTLGPPICIHIIVGAIPCQLFKLCCIFTYGYSPLLQTQELNLLLSLQICREVLIEEPLFEQFPSNCPSLSFHLPPGIFPPSLCFLSQHVGSIDHLLTILATYGSENLL
ncbi:hypothetical protein Lalb_Chr15g0080561 [Lupinus albus]|uniref:Uncharacterized protein n=1 Tax=Lupinus albus TaxID=3870 RepID=A0A6A4P6I4_LUPAL|nr:hypothetical protein Lalb_Chr15g0080561 [Lupinus albus]